MDKSVKVFLVIIVSSLFCSCNSSNNAPYTRVTLTEEGAKRINVANERQNNYKKMLSKYSNWLQPNYMSLEPKKAVQPGDELDEDMNFEIYPSDIENLNKMFLIGRTKPSFATKDTINLVNITTNIPEEEISDYSLNGQISYIDGSGDVNHDKIQFNSFPYQKKTEFTMTYTYIKKGTAADTSPYSCQPSFHITKVDNDAPAATTSNELLFKASYTQTPAQLREYLATEIGKFFTIKDSELTKTVNIEYTDAELETARSASIAAAKADSENHQFTEIDIPFTVSTENASTETLHARLNLVDDVLPAVYKNGVAVNDIQLNGGTNLKMVHYSTVNSGAKALLASNGYTVEDEIKGATDLDFKWDVDGYLVANGSYNNEPVLFKDLTTKFNSASLKREDTKVSCYRAQNYIHLIKVAGMDKYPSSYSYEFKPDESTNKYCISSIYSADVYGEVVTATDMIWIIDDLHLNDGTVFEEVMTPEGLDVMIGDSRLLIINSSATLDYISVHSIGFSLPVFINTDCIPNKDESHFASEQATRDTTTLDVHDIHLTASEYDQSWYYRYYNFGLRSSHVYFAFKLAENASIQDVNYNFTLAAFKAKYNIEYGVE